MYYSWVAEHASKVLVAESSPIVRSILGAAKADKVVETQISTYG